ncbi:MAG: serine hydrolase domain-containing protein [Gammaproteobacteria bacterium]
MFSATRTTLSTLTIISSALISGLVSADNLSYSSPESVGMSSEALERIAPLLQQYVDSGELVGVVSMLARHGEIVHFDNYGTLDKDTGAPIEKDSLFRIYSMSKPITTVAAMMLYEEGKFQLSDPVSKFLPEFANLKVMGEGGSRVAPERPMTMQMLMSHTAGLTYGVFGDTLVDRQYRDADILSNTDLAEMTSRLGEIPLQYQPGTRFHYSVSVDVLGRVVEVLSGQSLDAFFEQRIFTPLEMTDTFFEVPADKKPRFGTNHSFDPSTKTLVVSDRPETSAFANEVTFFSGGGGLVSSTEDYMRFSQMLLNGGELDGARILGRKTIEFMTQNHLPGIFGGPSLNTDADLYGMSRGTGFGLGFAVVEDPAGAGGITSPGEFYWGGAAGTIFWIDPVEDLIGIVMVQHMNVQVPLRNTFKAVSYGALIE